MTKSDRPLLLIVDGHSLAYRAYYALAKAKKGALRTSTGIPTSVCFGFLNSLFTIISDYQPQYVAVAFDLKEATFRHTADSNYKGDRTPAPDDFIEDVNNLQILLKALNIQIVTAVGYEADDVIGTLATQAVKSHCQVKILSGDRDLFQLVDDEKEISVLYLERNLGKYGIYKEEEVFAKMKVKPSQIVDFKALCGDKSDSIPGVLGIGEKIASNLLAEYETLDKVYHNLDSIKSSVKNKLINGEKDAQHSQFLAKIVTDINLEISLDDLQLTGFNNQEIIPLLQTLELNSFVKQINQIQKKLGGTILDTPEENNNGQLSLFTIGKGVKDTSKGKQKDVLEYSNDKLLKNNTISIKDSQGNSGVNNNSQSIDTFIVDDIEKLETLISKIKQAKITAWDTETDSLETLTANLVGIGCCWGKTLKDTAYIPLHHKEGKQLTLDIIQTKLEPILNSIEYQKTFHNAKFDRLIFLNNGIEITGIVCDTMLASYVLQPEESHKLSNLCIKYGCEFIAQDYDNLGLDKKQTIADLPIEKTANYCALDVLATFHLTEILTTELERIPSLKKVFELELKLEPILAQMEQIGVLIDSEYLQELAKEIDSELLTIETEAYEEAGEEFNLASPKQMSELLFEKLGLNKRKSSKTKTGYSTNQAVLEKLKGDHPIIDLILQHRTLAKLKSTYVDTLPTLVNQKTQRLHTNYNQTVTATGRLSSSNPNLQNIPIRTAFSRQIRKAFIPQSNWVFLSADYSQIELRILAHLSNEPILISAYQNNQDIHTVTAKLLLEKEDITPEERNLGKTINFGVIYGMGAQKFSRETGVKTATAQKFIDIYREKYANIFNYLENQKKEALVNGYVTTILGRRRYFYFNDREAEKLINTDINSFELSDFNFNYQTIQMLRSAANAPIQGSSADIIKLAMIEVNKILAEEEGNLLLQVHDELVFELPLEKVDDLSFKIKKAMENVLSLKIPLLVDIHTGNNWMEAK
ncbi:DNA polymerase I [Cyanobacterium aponinum UTEX 3222]|uniref:DNA polymerase I n=1 Tax=Cyanobacterium aponinum TaxID=379064 RepID=UPI002B4C1239|nr:DNA polymerase I [Cyanobacterium aponinum]WRL38955.1 DNA polymerase I [Cyanobacterium aponinum UTEX 3221]WRL40734.1 DNA polymerase I [Cyanobacterium aponinum UTEX 3222]